VSEKERRLRDLARHTERIPATCWGYDDFAALRPTRGTRWWVRSLATDAAARYRHAQGPWVPAEVDAFFANLDKTARTDAFVIQQYVEPVVAGATLCTEDGVLTEGVAGPASLLLREGEAGDLLASHDNSLSWRLHRHAISDDAVLKRAHDSIPLRAGTLWEWIVDSRGEVFHVDRKELQVPLLTSVPTGGPPTFWALGRPRTGPFVELSDTSIDGLNELSKDSALLIRRGSPLAHLCYEAVVSGHHITLEVPDFASARP
jgi:hypothetical protein